VTSQQPWLLDFRSGSIAVVELSWHVGFTPDFGRMVATQELTLRADSVEKLTG